jgi:hypothetical protein
MTTYDGTAGEDTRGLWLVIEGEPDADAEEVDRLTRQLRAELMGLDEVETIERASSADLPEGAKGAGVDWATLLMTVSASGGALSMLIGAVRDWLNRSRSASTVTLTIDGDSITLPKATKAEREELIQTWIARHGHQKKQKK